MDHSNGNLIETKICPAITIIIIIFPLEKTYFRKIWTLKSILSSSSLAGVLCLFKCIYIYLYTHNLNMFLTFLTLKFRKAQIRLNMYKHVHACMGNFVFIT